MRQDGFTGKNTFGIGFNHGDHNEETPSAQRDAFGMGENTADADAFGMGFHRKRCFAMLGSHKTPNCTEGVEVVKQRTLKGLNVNSPE